MIKTILLLALSFTFSGVRKEQGASLMNNWRLLNVHNAADHKTIPVPDNVKSFMRITDKVFKGSSGCNDFGGSCLIKPDSITFGNANATKKFCQGTTDDIERLLLRKLFGSTAKYSITGDTLVLVSKEATVFKYYKMAG